MRESIWGVLTLVAVVGLALPASGQIARNRTTIVEEKRDFTPRLPSTATFKITRVRRLADGTTITQESTEVLAWDSQKRQMTSTTTIPQTDDQTPATHFVVLDRVARTISRWSVPGQRATVSNLPVTGSGISPCATSLTLAEPDEVSSTARSPRTKFVSRPVTQNLGVEIIQDVEARGTRTTTTIPAGAIGNSEPLVRTSEFWRATQPGLDLAVRTITDDPQTGKMTKELENLDINEPNPSLFQPPADYEVVQKDAPACPSASAVNVEQPSSPPVPASDPEQ